MSDFQKHLNELEDFVAEFGNTRGCFDSTCLVCAREIQATKRAQEAIEFLQATKRAQEAIEFLRAAHEKESKK